ncbi:MAG: InlB B-repeat-containing protein [Ruminococcus sp.]|nr:InlB B-repeat-containing protein [Ruminococcus sp.]
MKRTKRIAAAVMALALAAGAAGALPQSFKAFDTAVSASADAAALEDTSATTLQEEYATNIGYYVSDRGFDILGVSGDKKIQTTFSYHGFLSYMMVEDSPITDLADKITTVFPDGSNKLTLNSDGSYSGSLNNPSEKLVLGKVYDKNGVQFRITPEILDDEKTVHIRYDILNTTDIVKYGKLGCYADTMVNSNDRCTVSYKNSGITMVDANSGVRFNVSINNRAVSGKWTGLYTERHTNLWSNSDDYTIKGYEGKDSAISWHWDYELQPGEQKSFDEYISAGEFYVVDFETFGGTEITPSMIAEGQTADEPETPTKEGYVFDGWYADEDCTTPYDFTTPITNDTTIYAKWAEAPEDESSVTEEESSVAEEESSTVEEESSVAEEESSAVEESSAAEESSKPDSSVNESSSSKNESSSSKAAATNSTTNPATGAGALAAMGVAISLGAVIVNKKKH